MTVTLRRFVWLLACFAANIAVAGTPADAPRWQGQATTLFTHHAAAVVSSGTAMAQDGRGFLWIGTQSGLVRWDGYRFRRFAADPADPGALRGGDVTALHVDGLGRLWVGTSAGGLARFDAADERFIGFPVGAGGTQGDNVTSIVGDGAGGLWVGGHGGLDRVDADDVVRPPDARDPALSLPEGGIEALLQDRSGALWVGTSHGLFRRPGPASPLTEVPLGPAAAGAARITCLVEDSTGRIWIGTRGRGAFVVEPGTGARRAVVEGGGRAALTGDTVLAITEAAAGEVWLGTYGGGIVAVDPAGSARRIRRQVGVPNSLADDDVMALFRDRSGIVWVASVSTLSRHVPQQQAVLSLLGDPTTATAMRSGNVVSALARADGRLWLGVGSEGVDIIDPRLGRVGQLRSDGDRPRTALPKARVLGMVERPGGGVYVGTMSGLYLADDDGHGARRLEVPGRDPAAPVWSLAADGEQLWLGGADALWQLDPSDPQKVRVLGRHASGGIGGTRLMAVLRGAGPDLWVGTDRGLFRLDVESGGVEHVGAAADPSVRGPNGMVSSLLIDARGRLWFSCYGDGVWRLEPASVPGRPVFRHFGHDEGLVDLNADKLLEDRLGRIWASTDDGLAVIDGESGSARALRRPEGVHLLAYWTNAGTRTPAGELVFGGEGGISIVRPERLTQWRWRAPVVVTDARVDGVALPAGRLDPSAGNDKRLDVPAGARGLSIEFAALDYSAPEELRYAYRLRGFDEDWVPADAAHRTVGYTNLPPGDYTLELRGSNRDGVWTEPPLALPVRVRPAWFQTAAFRAAVGVALLLFVAGLVQARTAFLRRRQRELEALVAARTASLEQRSEELRASQEALERIAYADPLTGLPNRRWFNDALRHQVAQALRGGPAFALLLIDLDGFKAVNDTHGHDAGDAVLAATALRLLVAVRAADRVARLGGDEFAVLLTQDPAVADVDAVCRRIVVGLAEPVAFEGASLGVSASIGIADTRAGATVPAGIFKAADLALYAAKRSGRNTWRWHGESTAGGTDFAAATDAMAVPAGRGP